MKNLLLDIALILAWPAAISVIIAGIALLVLEWQLIERAVLGG